ncbi:hypothetical protein HDU91_003934, partial [Kappamyces sp. JEL0680]
MSRTRVVNAAQIYEGAPNPEQLARRILSPNSIGISNTNTFSDAVNPWDAAPHQATHNYFVSRAPRNLTTRLEELPRIQSASPQSRPQFRSK